LILKLAYGFRDSDIVIQRSLVAHRKGKKSNMYVGDISAFEDVCKLIGVESKIWIRCVARRTQSGDWEAWLVELTSGESPPSWKEIEWSYPRTVFISGTASGTEVARQLRVGVLEIADISVLLPQLQPTVNWQKRQSSASSQYEVLRWPVWECTMASMADNFGSTGDHVISADGSPSFFTFETAVDSYFGLAPGQTRGQTRYVVYRHQDLRARIDRVRISEDQMTAWVQGDNSVKLILELAGYQPGTSLAISPEQIGSSDGVDIPLTEGLPPGAWILTRTGDEWIDRRFLSPFVGGTIAQEGVEFVVDAGTRLESLVALRERQFIEYKVQVPQGENSKRKAMKTVAAFANGEGGSMLIGVDDERNVVGVDPRSIDSLRDQMTQMIGSWVEPRPKLEFEVLPMSESEKVVLEIQVSPDQELHGCGLPSEIRTIYVRHFGVTERATPQEISTLVKSRAATTARPFSVLS
jgi:hypothetical protein